MKWMNQNGMNKEAGALAPEPYQIRLSVQSEAGVGSYGRVPGDWSPMPVDVKLVDTNTKMCHDHDLGSRVDCKSGGRIHDLH
jgi:hypothetical protein